MTPRPSSRLTANRSRLLGPLVAALLVFTAGLAEAAANPRVVQVGPKHRFLVTVPKGFEARFGQGRVGPDVVIGRPDGSIYLHVEFALSNEAQIETPEWQAGAVARLLARDRDMTDTRDDGTRPLEPRTGSGVFTVLTDLRLLGLSVAIPDDYVYKTAGVRAWPGCVMVFQLMSNETLSPDYEALLRLAREDFNPAGR
jgi:hypothetical protein